MAIPYAHTPRGVRLEGYDIGPVHGDAADRLLAVLAIMPQSESGRPEVESLITQATGYERQFSCRTSDGYIWARAYVFNTVSGKVVLLIPMAANWSADTGYVFGRMPCAYSVGRASADDAQAVLGRVATMLENVACN